MGWDLGAVVEEGIDEDNSDDSDTTDDEQNEDEEDETTPVTNDGDNKSDDESDDDLLDEDGSGSDEEPNEETTPVDEEIVSEDEDSDTIDVNGSTINAVTPTSVGITVEQYEKDGTPAATEGGQATDKKLDGNGAAEVTFIDGTSADDSKALGGNRPVKFRLDMKDGWKAEGLTVSYTIAKGGDVTEDKTETITASSEVYTVPTNVAATTGDNATPASYSGNITIKIVANAVKSTVKLSAAASNGETVCLVKTDGTPDTTKAITEAASQELNYAASTADVTLAVSGLTAKYNTIDVAIGSEDATTIAASGTKDVTEGDTTTKYQLFTFNPSELNGFDKNADNDVKVTLKDGEEAHGLTLALDSGRTDKWAVDQVTPAESTTEDYITINDGKDGFVAVSGGLNEDNYANNGATPTAKKRVLAFTVTPSEANSLKLKGEKPVKAVLTTDANVSDLTKGVQTLEATRVAEVKNTDGTVTTPAYWKIDLSSLTKTNFTDDMTLTITVDTEIDETANDVHTISFKGDVENVKLETKFGAADSFTALKSPYSQTEKMDAVTFSVEPKAGYSLSESTDYNDAATIGRKVVNVTYDKVYKLKTKDTEPKTVTVTVPVTTPTEIIVTDEDTDGVYEAEAFEFTDNDFKDADWKDKLPSGTTVDQINVGADNNAGDMAYTKENVVVTIKTVLASGKTGSVTIESAEADYELSGDGITKSIGDTYRISEEAELLTLTITSDVEPTVGYVYDSESEECNEEAEVKAGESEGTYVAEIPVSELATAEDENGETVISDTIVISKGTNTLTVNSTTDGDDDDSFGGEIYVNDIDYTNEGTISLTSGMKANVKIVAPTGTELVSVNKKVGDDGEEEAVELGEDKGSVTFQVTMTDNVVVKVALKSIYAATVRVGSATKDAEQDDNGVYIIPAGSTGIKVSLVNGETAAPILYAKVYDGNEIAVTTATWSENVATIDKISDDDKGVLRVDLAAVATKKVVASVEIKQEQAASELVIKDAKNKAVTSVSLMADGPAAEFTVSAASGRLDYAKENIGFEVVAKADDPVPTTPATSNDFVTASYADGKLTISAKPAKEGKETAAVIRFYDKAKRTAAASDATATDKLCLMASAITVNTTAPSVVGQKPVVKEATGTDKTLKVELSTSDKVVKPVSNNKVFYKVEITGTLTTGLEATQYIEKTAWGKNSQIAEIVVDNTPDADGKRVEGSAKDYALKVELVQTTTQTTELTDAAAIQTAVKTEATNSTLAIGGQVAELKKISTRNPLYETKLNMKPASVTVYTGQTLGKVVKAQTQAQFNKKTGYTVVPYVQFVNTQTGVLLGDASNPENPNSIATYGYEDDEGTFEWEAKVDANGNVFIGYNGGATAAKYQPKNIGLKVTAEYPEGAYAATAIVKINVVNGIENINFVSGDYRSLYKKSGKPATLKLSPILNWGSKDEAPKKKTLTFAMGDAYGVLPEDGGDINAEVASKVKVNPKNGTVTVDKNYDVTKGGTFSVVAKAADYEGNEVTTGTVKVDITDKAQELGEVVIVETSDWNNYKVVARNGGTLNAEDFFTTYTYVDDGETQTDVRNKWLGVKALKTTAGTKRVYTDDDFVWGVSYASSAKAALSTDTDDGYLRFIKPNAKPVKLTITPADGSGTKGKKDMSVTVKGFEKLGLEMYDSNHTHYDARELNHTYDGAMNERFTLTAVAEMWDDFYKDCRGLSYTNYNVTAKGAKITSKWNGGMDIVMTASTATITIADKTEKSVKAIYTITQDPAAPAKAKAPSIKQIGKLTAADVEAVRSAESDDEEKDVIKLQVTNKNATPVNHARQYVFLTPDYTKTKYVSGQGYEYDRADKYFLNYAGTVIKQIDDNGRFALDLNVAGEETFAVVPGTYTLIATVGNYKDGKFEPAAKGVNVKINIPGKAAKNSLTVKGKYTLDASAMAPVDLASGKNIVTDYHWTLTNAKDANNNYAMNKIDPKTGKANNFTKYFEVKETGDSFTLGLKSNLTKADIEYITGQVKETAKDAKADCEGYVTVSSYSYNENYPMMTKDMKITVSFKDAKYVAKTAEASVYTGADATVQIFETAKSTDPIVLAGAYIEPDDKNGGAALVDTTSGVTERTNLKVKLSSAEAGKSYKVTFKVLAADSAYATMAEGNASFIERAKEYGRTVTATIKVSGKDDKTKNKVAVTGKAFKITADDFTAAATPTAVNGEYKLVIPVRSAIEGTEITGATVPTTVKDKDYEGKDIVSATFAAKTQTAPAKVTLIVKRDKLIEANAAKGGKFKFGKAVDVPVTFTFADTAVAAETVNLKVTLPNPMTFEKAVEAATKLEAVIGDMKDDLLFAEADDMKEELEDRIESAIQNVIPKDVQAAKVTRENITLTPVAKTDKTPASYKTTVSVWKAATKADGDYEHEYTFTQGEEITTAAYELASAIGDLEADDLTQLGNDYTPDKLLADVKAALAKQEPAVKIPANLSLSVTYFKLKKATAKEGGKLNAEIAVRDRNDVSYSSTAQLNNITFDALGTLADAKDAVSDAVAAKSGDEGIDYSKVIYDALKNATNLTGVEGALKKAIVDAANAAITNPDITIKSGEEFEKIEKADDSDNPTTVATGKAKVDVDFKLPVGDRVGSVSFKLILRQEGMKNVIVNETITVAATSADDENVNFTTLSGTVDGLKTSVFKSDWTEGTPNAASIKDDVYCNTTDAIKTEIEKRLAENVKGVGISYTVTGVAFTDGATGPSANAAVSAEGLITITDKLSRGATAADNKVEVKFTANIPKFEKVLGTMKVMGANITDDASATLTDVTSAGLTVNSIEDAATLKFRVDFDGSTWLDATDKAVTYMLVESATKPDGEGKTLDDIKAKETTGVVLTSSTTDGTATITVNPTLIADKTQDTVLYLRASKNAKKLGDADIAEADSIKIVTVTLKFKQN